MNYPSIRIEGSIFSPDLLDRLEDAVGQRPADFGLDSGAKVKDEIVRAWADAQDYWRIFQRKLDTVKSDSPATTETRQQWMVPLLGLLGYQLEYQARGVELNGKNYPISHRAINRGQTPVQIIGYREAAGLDRKPEKAVLRMSAHAMVQEYLNLQDELYGIVTNGRLLRLLRDSSRLVKLTYLEFDLDRIFTDGLFADFAMLYRLLHASRLPASADTASDSLIEKYHQDSLDSGARIREGLSQAVEQAIKNFANGFLTNPVNEAFREHVQSGKLSPEEYYKQLLRLIYRLLFLMVIEERDLVFPAMANAKKREIYNNYYSLQRLRRLSEKRYLADKRKCDLWQSLVATFSLFEADGPGEKLGISPLAGDLFDSSALGQLGKCQLGNDVLLNCLRSLGLYQHPDTRQMIRVNYAALNVEEFGSVYEGLLEHKPVIGIVEGRSEFDFARGDERATTGSHYTPDDLVQPLIKHSLDYLIADKLKEKDPERALLSLRVADISCGSGHILLAASRRIAAALASVRTGEDQPSPTAFRAAVRDVIRECIFGVDLNPLAVELCKVALWLEAHNPGQPLNFLDHHIKCGNSIVGFVRREDVERGVPDEAFATMPGDDKEIAATFRKKNKTERAEKQQAKLDLTPEIRKQLESILPNWRDLSALPERTPKEIEEKKRRYLDFTQHRAPWFLNQIASIPVAQFFIPKNISNKSKLITDSVFREYWSGQSHATNQGIPAAWSEAQERHFFNWFLEFPEIIENGGFDCILGNPPYLGTKHLSGTLGYPLCNYVQWEYAPAGLSDLVAYFVRRIYILLRSGGFTAFITTNSIKDGDVRRDGLEQIVSHGATINFAIRGIKWPGRAKLIVALVALHRGVWMGKKVLDGKEVPAISTYFEDSLDTGDPKLLHENAGKMYQGSIFLGNGFVLSHEEADRLIASDVRNKEVIFRAINGEELNTQPNQAPQRSIINFHDWDIERAKQYREPFQIVEEKVKPFRAIQNRARNREIWWIYAEHRPGMNRSLSTVKHCYVTTRVSKYLNFSLFATNHVFLNTTYVFTSDRWDLYAFVQSTLHEVWARKYGGSLGQTLSYFPTDCFETFPFPSSLWQVPNRKLETKGEKYQDFRRSLMLSLWLGLTDVYNLFHARDLTPTLIAKVSKKAISEAEDGYRGIMELRKLHQGLDIAVRDAYGWQDLDLGHDFYEVETLPENDRIRYTISPAARKEVLRRLLALNHERAAAESANMPAKRKRSKKVKKADASQSELL